MRVTEATFIKSVLKADQLPKEGWAEIAFTGRSNVGKSSLLNALLRRKGLAKTSGTPGKTQTLNYFAINRKFYFVDLPGYGYAKVPLSLKAQWNVFMREYLSTRTELRLACALVDGRHAPSDNDIAMLDLLATAEVPTLVVATKIDKVKRSERHRNLKRIREGLGLDEEALIVPCSSETGEGLKEIWGVIEEWVAAPQRELEAD